MIRELSTEEMEEVNGALGPVGLVAGFVGGVAFEFVTNPGASFGDLVLGGVIGGVGVATGGLLAGGTTAARVTRLNRIGNRGGDAAIEVLAGAAGGGAAGFLTNARTTYGGSGR